MQVQFVKNEHYLPRDPDGLRDFFYMVQALKSGSIEQKNSTTNGHYQEILNKYDRKLVFMPEKLRTLTSTELIWYAVDG